MNKICTDIEQSKKLIELGIDVNTADMFWDMAEPNKRRKPIVGPISDYFDMEDWAVPAWSLSALMNLLPSEFTEVGKSSTTIYQIHIRKDKFTDEVNSHQIAYGSYKWHEDGGYTWSDMINTGEKEDLLDAAFEMVYWLLENKKL